MDKYIDEVNFLIGDVHLVNNRNDNEPLFGFSFEDLTQKIERKIGDILFIGIACINDTCYRIYTTVNIFNGNLLDTQEDISAFIENLKENGYCNIMYQKLRQGNCK